MKLKNVIKSMLSAMCILAGTAGNSALVFAEEDLSTQITVYVTDNDSIPPDGSHTFVLADGGNQIRTFNIGNSADFTVTLPSNQDVKTVLLYEEQNNPAGYIYDGSVYGISLVANYDHTSLDSVDVTKDGVEYNGSIFFANKLQVATQTPTPTATPQSQPTTQPQTVIDPNTGQTYYVDPNGNISQNPTANPNAQNQ